MSEDHLLFAHSRVPRSPVVHISAVLLSARSVNLLFAGTQTTADLESPSQCKNIRLEMCRGCTPRMVMCQRYFKGLRKHTEGTFYFHPKRSLIFNGGAKKRRLWA